MDKEVVLLSKATQSGGFEIAKKLAETYSVVLVDTDKDKLEEMKANLKKENVDVNAFPLVYEKEAANKLVSEITTKVGPVTALVNHWAYAEKKTFFDIKTEDVVSSFHSIITDMMIISQATSDYMIENKIKGHIVNASTDEAFEVNKDDFLNSVLCWSLRGTTRAMAKQLADKDIKVNAYCRGEGTDWNDVADTILFLIGEENINITGQNIMVNSGRVMD